jgi:hypothetical protein
MVSTFFWDGWSKLEKFVEFLFFVEAFALKLPRRKKLKLIILVEFWLALVYSPKNILIEPFPLNNPNKNSKPRILYRAKIFYFYL